MYTAPKSCSQKCAMYKTCTVLYRFKAVVFDFGIGLGFWEYLQVAQNSFQNHRWLSQHLTDVAALQRHYTHQATSFWYPQCGIRVHRLPLPVTCGWTWLCTRCFKHYIKWYCIMYVHSRSPWEFICNQLDCLLDSVHRHKFICVSNIYINQTA